MEKKKEQKETVLKSQNRQKEKPLTPDTTPESPQPKETREVPAQISSKWLGLPLQDAVVEEDPHLTRFKEFLDNEWGPPAVTVLFRQLFGGGFPPIPPPSRWQIPSNINLEQLVWEQVQTENFILEVWPSVKILLGDDICNSRWAAQIATVFALFNILKVLPVVLGDIPDAKRTL